MMGEFTPLPALAVGTLGTLSVVLAVSLGLIRPDEHSIFSAVLLVVMLTAATTILSIASAEHEPDRCVFSSED
jgi:hypothetical protein